MYLEIWKLIDGYNNYSVSNLGNVKKLATTVYNSHIGNYDCPECNLQPKVYNGFLCVNFNSHSFPVHRLVANAFIPNPQSKPLICHIDGDVKNNRTDNLIWCTRSEYNKHKQQFTNISLTPPKFAGKSVVCVETNEIFQSIKEAANKLGVSADRLSRYMYLNKPIHGLHYILKSWEGINRD